MYVCTVFMFLCVCLNFKNKSMKSRVGSLIRSTKLTKKLIKREKANNIAETKVGILLWMFNLKHYRRIL